QKVIEMEKLSLAIALLICLSCAEKEESTTEQGPPNILFILVDDLGKEWLSCYGADSIQTPNIDKLAQSGILFNNVYGMPQCTPSRVTLLTGQYPFRHGWVNHWDVPRWGGGAHFDETENPALVTEIKKAGYKTCIAGKWQIDDFRVEPDALTKLGFDEYCMWTGKETGNPSPSEERYQSPYIFTKNGSKTYENKFGPDVFKDFICDFIKANKDSSMFIYYPMVLTHTPFVNTPADTATTNLGKHKAMVKYTDWLTGEIVQTLEQAGVRENTVIIWTTDNGTTGRITGSRHGKKVKGAKSKTSEAGACLPFLLSWPSVIEANSISNALIDFTDVLPTFLDLCGVHIDQPYTTGRQTQHIDGVSFKDVLLGQEHSNRSWILSMGGGNDARLTENGIENKYVYRDRVIRDERFKLCLDTRGKAVAFYDLLAHPEEDRNLIDSLDSPIRKQHFEALLSVSSKFPEKDSDPRYKPNPAQEWDVDISARSLEWKE
ncbi:MAG: sulfatase-like hydrolase/transferase, partial [Bacteroidota bacterium]